MDAMSVVKSEVLMTTMLKRAPEGVTTNVRQLIAGTEDLLDTIRKTGGEQYNEAVERIESEIERMKADLDELQDTIAARARAAARRTDRIVHAHPWAAAGTAAAVGVVLGAAVGVLVGRQLSQRND
jgi:ElaB/YqjD/DUF883 family membrane-anchored ribosome-binding protein